MPKSTKRSKRQSGKKVRSSTKPRKVRKSSKRKGSSKGSSKKRSSKKRSSKRRSKRVKKGGNFGFVHTNPIAGHPEVIRLNTCVNNNNRSNFNLKGGGGCGKKH